MIDTDVETGTFWPVELRRQLRMEITFDEWQEHMILGRWHKERLRKQAEQSEFVMQVKEKLGIPVDAE